MRNILLAPLRLQTRPLPYIPRGACALYRSQFQFRGKSTRGGSHSRGKDDFLPDRRAWPPRATRQRDQMSSAYARPTKAAQPTGRQNALPGSAMNNQSGENSPAKPTKGRQSKQGKQSTHGNQPRQQKQSSQSNQHVGQPITMEYIQDHFSLPTRAQYANAPNAFWYLLEQNAPHVKQSYVQKIFADHLNFQRSKKGTPPHGHSHRLQFIAQAYDGRQYAAVGDGTTETEALRICAIHLIAQLHETGQLNQFFGRPAIEIVTKDTRGSHNHKVAVYEYASRFTEVPQFTARPVTDEVLQKVRAQGNYKVKYECTAELPELGLVAIGAGVTLTQAENAAAIRLEVLAREREELAHRDSPLKASTMDSFLNYWDHGKGVLTTSYTERTITGHKIYTAHAELGGQPCGKPVSLIQRSQAEHLAILSAAIALGKEDPTLLPGFEAALEEAGGKIPRRLKPIQISLPDRVLDSMESAIKEQRGVKTHDKPLPVEGVSDAPMRTRSVRGFTNQDQRNAALQQAFKAYQESSSTQLMRKKREELPINLHRAEILDMCKDSPFSVVVGATGSGKTTQVPQMFLEAASEMGEGALCNVICTQPRRIAATSVARRVADERAEKLSDSVGYTVRHNNSPPRQDGSILFCTTGILLQRLQHNPDEVFDTTSHILLDEVHERDILLDFLLVVLKKALKLREAANKFVPKVVLMSATMNTDLFSKYFGTKNASGQLIPCPSINVPGRLFPVRNRYLRDINDELSHYRALGLDRFLQEKDTEKYIRNELDISSRKASSDVVSNSAEDDFDPDDALVPIGLVAATVAHIAKTTDEGAILVFLPGNDEILRTQRLLTQKTVFGVDFLDTSRYKLFVLHSTTSSEDQAAVFNPVPPGCRKIILSTNIAETSVTIPDVQHVVDSGKHRENRYDSINRITALKTAWVSKANAKQRAGRAGRVQNGNYYALYTEERHERLRITGKAEMLRADLQEICLDVKAHGFSDSVGDFLSQALEPPPPSSVRAAISTLQSIEAFTENEELTPLGELLAALPVEPALGKMIVLGIIFQCLDPLIILGALSGSRNLFGKPSGKRSEWESRHLEWLSGSQSEHMAQINAFKHIRSYIAKYGQQAAWDFANQNYIVMSAYEQTRRAAEDIEQLLIKSQLIPYTPPTMRNQNHFGNQYLNTNSGNINLIKALALVGFAPNLAVNTYSRWFRTRTSDDVGVHPKSTIAGRKDHIEYGGAMMTYSTLSVADDGFLTMRDITEVSHESSLFFGGKLKMNNKYGRYGMEIDGWLPINIKQGAGVVDQFRRVLDTFLSNSFRELTSYRLKNANSIGGEKSYFATDTKRNTFAQTLVRVFDQLDHRTKLFVQSGGTRSSSSSRSFRNFGGTVGSALKAGTGDRRAPATAPSQDGRSSPYQTVVRGGRTVSSVLKFGSALPSQDDRSRGPTNPLGTPLINRGSTPLIDVITKPRPASGYNNAAQRKRRVFNF